MKATHTPGPWTVSFLYPDDEGQPELAISAKVGGKDCHPAAVCLQFPNMQGMQMANARLISAAPELLVALQNLLTLYQRKRPGVWGSDLDQVKATHAAIKKATGEA